MSWRLFLDEFSVGDGEMAGKKNGGKSAVFLISR